MWLNTYIVNTRIISSTATATYYYVHQNLIFNSSNSDSIWFILKIYLMAKNGIF